MFLLPGIIGKIPGNTAEIADKGPIALQQAKKSINFGSALDISTAFTLEAESYNTCLFSDDRIEGLNAFAEKRKPIYRGR